MGKELIFFYRKKLIDLTRSFLKKLIKKNLLKINNKIVSSPSIKLKTNDYLEIKLIYDLEQKLIPKKIKLDIIYEDKDILIVNKQKGLVVHPGAGNFKNTLSKCFSL